PHFVSASAAALASFSTFTGTLYFAETFSASGKFRQQGRFGGLITTPVRGSSGPGAQIPMPRTGRGVISESIAPITASSPASAEPLAIIGLRSCARILPLLSTNPTAILLPPIAAPQLTQSF